MRMEWENINNFNLGDLEEIPGLGKKGLVRVPAEVRNKLNERARFVGMDSVGIELQFVTDAPNIDIYLSAQKSEFNVRGIVRVYKGNFLQQKLEIEPGNVHFFRLNTPPNFKDANDKMLNNKGFSPNVWRIVCDRTTVIFKRAAHYVLANLSQNGYIPLCDYRQPKESHLLDSSAAAITACGLIEIAKAVPEEEKGLYMEAAINILKALDEKCTAWDKNEEALLINGTSQYHLSTYKSEAENGALIYGDYYFVEAVSKLICDIRNEEVQI